MPEYFVWPTISATHKARIQAARDGRVIGSFDDGPPIGEKSHFIGFTPEFQDKSVVLDRAVRAQPSRHLGKVHWAVPLMDLNRVPAAQGDLWPALSCQMDKFTLFAGLAAGTRPVCGDLSLLIAPYVKGEQSLT